MGAPRSRLEIRALDVDDDVALRGWWDCYHLAHAADREPAATRSWSDLKRFARESSSYERRELLVAVRRGRVVGAAYVALPLRDNTHLAEAEVCVMPAARRRGAGRRLAERIAEISRADGRTTLIGEAYMSADSDAPVAFARSLGMSPVHEEVHLVLDLPVEPEALADLRSGLPQDDGYEVFTWIGRCPDDLVEGFVRLRSQMSHDVPWGDLDLQAVTVDGERLRAEEDRLAGVFGRVVAVARLARTGDLVGYSQVDVDTTTLAALQDDTLVMPEHRGHRLGLRMKLATLALAQDRFSGSRMLHTWTAPDNGPMLRTNLELGYREVDRMFEMQARVDPGTP